MKIITDNSTNDLLTPLAIMNSQILVQDQSKMSVFDCFDRFEPEYVILSSLSLNNAYLKNIIERPHLKVVIIDDGGDKIEQLRSNIGNTFLLINRPDCYNPVVYKNIKFSKEIKSDIVCPNGHEITNIEKYYPSKFVTYRIFSNIKLINHNNYCGILREEFKPVAIKSAKISIVTNKDRLNAIYSNSIPVLNPFDCEKYLETDTSAILNDLKRELQGKSNFEQLSNIFLTISENRIAQDLLIVMENFI